MTKHPESRPEPVSNGQLEARFYPAVLKREQALSFQPGGGPVAAGVLSCADYQVAMAVQVCVWEFRVTGSSVGVRSTVGLDLAIAPASGAGIVRPFGCIGEGTGRAVELVAPDELPGLRG